MTLTARALAFLHGSNAIEDITNIDYADVTDGHVAAFVDSQALARGGKPLSLGAIASWQSLITREQVKYGHALPAGAAGAYRSANYAHDVRVGDHVAPSFARVPPLLVTWIEDVDARVASIRARGATDVTTAGTLGEAFQRFEAIHPFVDGNGRTGRLIANYLATVCGIPILVFRADERPAFYAAHRSVDAMSAFMGDKLREATFDISGDVLERVGADATSDVFPGLLVQRHELAAAQRRWRA